MNPTHIISLGAGVQSSTMALMAAAGELTPMPQCAIFADTQAEPKAVYTWLDWLEKQLPFLVYHVTAGNLMQRANALHISKKTGLAYTNSNVPVYLRMPGTNKEGRQSRQCTQDFKLVPFQRKARVVIGRSRSARVIAWIGISYDELHRMKPSRKRWITNVFPLVDKGLTRTDCLTWMKRRGFPEPPRSACSFCPFHGQAEWRRIRDTDPEAFLQAITFERQYQATLAQIPRISGVPFLHRSCVPLETADLSDKTSEPDQFGNECEGMCGV